jgi:intracellular sulfur oxidation DsrE/DsrF family protein
MKTSLLLSLLLVFGAPVSALAAPPAAPPKAKVVLIAFTGVEDLQRLTAPFKHALIMKKTGKLAEVAVVVYGRAVAAVSTSPAAIPDPLRAAVKAAQDAGVHLYVCETALAASGLTRESLVPGVEPVPQGAAKIAELIADGYSPIQY